MIIRVNKTRDYTVMSNYHFRDKELSLKAKGLLSQMLSLPADWDYTIAGLAAINKESKTAIKTALNELKERGYLVVTKIMPSKENGGRITYVYDIFEVRQGIEKQGIENLCLENQGVENPAQLNNNIPSEQIKNIHKSSPIKEELNTNNKVFKKPTLEEVETYCRERKNGIDAQRFINYYTANGWMVGKVSMKDWKAAVRTWEQIEKRKENGSFQTDEFFERAVRNAFIKHNKT